MDLSIQQKPSKRLIIVITNSLTNNYELAHAIHWMAEPEKLSILYLVLVTEKDNLLEISRNMATMKAVTSANRILVEVKTAPLGNWLTALRSVSNPEDEIICQEEQTVSFGYFKTQPLHDYLSSQVEQPVHIMSGYFHPIQRLAKKGGRELVNLLGFLIILSVFTWFQIQVEQNLDGLFASFYLIITLFLEFGTFWAWHKLALR